MSGLRLIIFSKSGGILPLETIGIDSNSLFFFNIDEPGTPTNESFEILFIRSAVREVRATTLVFLIFDVNKLFSLKYSSDNALKLESENIKEINKSNLKIKILRKF